MAQPSSIFLMYHELEVPGRPLVQSQPGYVRYVVRASDFRAQMELLNCEGWRGRSVSQALASSPQPGVAVTFDDGCATDLLAGAPILQELHFGATFYVTAGLLGRPGYMSDAQLRELAGLGFEIGCHSMTHAYLPDLDAAGLRREIVDAKTRLEQIIGGPVEHFSCPGGRYDARTVEMARNAGYRTVATSRIQANGESADAFALGRVAVLRDTDSAAFWKTCQGQGLALLKLRQTLREAVRRIAGEFDLRPRPGQVARPECAALTGSDVWLVFTSALLQIRLRDSRCHYCCPRRTDPRCHSRNPAYSSSPR